MQEETGLKMKQPIHTFHFYRGESKEEHLGVTFWCEYVSGEVKLDPNEHDNYKWIEPEEAEKYITNKSIVIGQKLQKSRANTPNN